MEQGLNWASGPAVHDKAVFLSCDAGLLPPSCFLASQILEMESPRDFDVVICVPDRTIVPSSLTGSGIRFCALDPAEIDGLPTSWRISPASYLRLIAIKAFETEYRRLLYLDGDMILRRPGLGGLLSTPMTRAVAAAPDISTFATSTEDGPRIKEYRASLGLAPDYLYRNSGVLLIDAPKAAEVRLVERIIDFARRNRHLLRFHDQSALNAALGEEMGQLSIRWNFPLIDALRDRLDDIDPVLIHFVGVPKPWKAPAGSIRHAYNADYQVYFRRYRLRFPEVPGRTPRPKWRRAVDKAIRYLRHPVQSLRKRRRTEIKTAYAGYVINQARLNALVEAQAL